MHTTSQEATMIEQCRSLARSNDKVDDELLRRAVMQSAWKGSSKNAATYGDDIVSVVADRTTNELRVTRVENNNPIVYQETDGKIFRIDSESKYLIDHVQILASILPEKIDGGLGRTFL